MTDTKVSLSFSLSFPPIFLVFLFFCDEENKRRERIRKKRVFSSSEFLRTFYEVYGCIRAVFSTSRARAVPSNARAWRGREGGDVSSSRSCWWFWLFSFFWVWSVFFQTATCDARLCSCVPVFHFWPRKGIGSKSPHFTPPVKTDECQTIIHWI